MTDPDDDLRAELMEMSDDELAYAFAALIQELERRGKVRAYTEAFEPVYRKAEVN